jgi:hypothetical protein
LEIVAELPQFLCRARVLEENSIDVERIKFAATVAIDSGPDMRDELSQLHVVVIRDQRTRRSSLRLAGHESRLPTTDPLSGSAWLATAGRSSGSVDISPVLDTKDHDFALDVVDSIQDTIGPAPR